MPPTKLELELYRRQPMKFRESILVPVNNKLTPFKDIMSPVQKQDFEARDEAMLWTARVPKFNKIGKPVERAAPSVRQFYTQRSRGYSKTSDIALDLIWLLIFCQHKIDGMMVAEDMDQARLMLIQAAKIVDNNPWLADYVDIQKKAIVNKKTGGAFNAWTSDVGSAWGATPDVVICDEFSHWTSKEWWDVTYSSFGKQGSLIVVGSNACKTGSWQIDLRETFKKDLAWYCSIPLGAAPWVSQQTLASQKSAIGYLEYLRVLLNEDSATGNTFIGKSFLEQCVDPDLERQEMGSDHVPTYFVTVDYAERTDRTVLTVGHLYDGTVIIDRMDVIDPLQRPTTTILVSEVIERLDQIDVLFGRHSNIVFVFDKYQMAHVIQCLKAAGKTVVEFEFKGGVGNHQASVLLQQYLMEKQIRWYPGCGEMYDEDGDVWQPQGVPDDLSTELEALIIKDVGGGKRWRFDHVRNKHDDRAFTLAAKIKVIHDLLLEDAEGDYYETEER